MASTYLTRTPGSASNRTTWTWSAWIKRSAISTGSYQTLWNAGSSAADDIRLTITNNDQIIFGTDATTFFLTSQRIRDVSAWYHIVFAFDTTQGTASDRAKLYINGSLVTDFSTDNRSSLSGSYAYNNTVGHGIGRQAYSGSTYYDGYMAHVNFTDGTQYAASDFGQTDSTTGIWVPKTAPSVTYGTNGFFLKMENSGAMGTDSSGNSNTWSVSGGNLIQVTDTPSNVFCTLNPLAKAGIAGVPYDGNLTHTGVGSGYEQTVLGTIMIPAGRGKWYWESKMTGASTSGIGVVATDVVDGTDYTGTYTFSSTPVAPWAYNYGWGVIGGTGNKKHDNAQSAYSTGDLNQVRQCAMDCENGKIYFGVNNVWGDSGDPAAGTNPAYTDTDLSTKNIIPWSAVSDTDGRNRHMNFGNPNAGFNETTNESDGSGFGKFKYAPPTGYYALCTKNLASYG